jgi:tetratricopeptide (TPR) repeat protein
MSPPAQSAPGVPMCAITTAAAGREAHHPVRDMSSEEIGPRRLAIVAAIGVWLSFASAASGSTSGDQTERAKAESAVADGYIGIDLRDLGAPAETRPSAETVDRSIPSSSPLLDRFAVRADDLPTGLTIGRGDPSCTSLQPLTFYAQPAAFGPRPLARRADLLRRGERLVGSVLMFEYRAEEVETVRAYLAGHLWGDAGRPTEAHPEDLVVVGRAVLVLCFDPQDSAGDWYIKHLQTRHEAAVARRCPALFELEREIARVNAVGPRAQAPIMARRESALLGCSFGAVRVGEVARELGDWPRAETAFRRALALAADGDSLTIRGARFVAHYGLALAVAARGREEESLPLFERALQVARAEGSRQFEGWAQFNLACVRAELRQYPAAAEALQAAIAIDPSHRTRARSDPSFRKARRLPAFKRLLG